MFDDLFSSFSQNLRYQALVKIYKNDNSQKYVPEKSAKKPLLKTGLRENLSPWRRTLRCKTGFGNWKPAPFKNNEKCFLFHLKSPFRSQDI